MENKYLLTFVSTHDAISAEKTLSQYIKTTIRPTPREITASCGISIEIRDLDFCMENSLLGRIPIYKVYKYEDGRFIETDILKE